MSALPELTRPRAARSAAEFAHLRAVREELAQAATATERYEALRSLGVDRPTVCLRIQEEFYSMEHVCGEPSSGFGVPCSSIAAASS
jgi:hypothetical protein